MNEPKGDGPASVAQSASNGGDWNRYTLQRDGDRPLQFDGQLLGSAESSSARLRHRVALYKTKAGKFVTEFTTLHRELLVRSGQPSDRDITDLRAFLSERIRSQADLRDAEGARVQDPYNRSAMASTLLRRVAASVDELPAASQQWTRLWFVFRGEDTDQLSRLSNFLAKYAFEEMGHPFAWLFLTQLHAILADHVETVSTAKAAVFDEIDAALKWFREGKLTNELLRHLGRLKPEFIE
jgi:inactivated superfamily I helicase